MNWFATELHCHTINSDGQLTVTELIEAAKYCSLDGIALTDHNTISGWSELSDELEKKTVTVLKGIEWTTFFGHMLVMDCPVFVDWRDALPDNIDEKIMEVRLNGGLVGIAHPFELGSPMCTGCYWDYHVRKWEHVSFIEVWSEAFPSVQTLNHRAIALWNTVLDKGYHVAATYGKDWHRLLDETVPSACTYLGTENSALTAADMKAALLEGRTAITMGPFFIMKALQNERDSPIGSTIESGLTVFSLTVDLTMRRKHWEKFEIKPISIRIIATGGETIAEILSSESAKVELNANPGWYRGELWGSVMGKECCIALTSPIYCD